MNKILQRLFFLLCISMLAAYTWIFFTTRQEPSTPHAIVMPLAQKTAAPPVSSSTLTLRPKLAPVATSTRTASSAPPIALPANTILVIDGTPHSFTATPAETVIAAMRALQGAGVLSFTGHDYAGLGFFVESINGKPNADGMYWILYVNGTAATSGASSVVIRPGDRIAWQYEKSYQ